MRPAFPLFVIISAAVLLGLWSAWSILRSRTLLTTQAQRVALALRLAAIALAAVILCNPVVILPSAQERPVKPCAVLVDRSASMAGERALFADTAMKTLRDGDMPGGLASFRCGSSLIEMGAKGDDGKAGDDRSDLCRAILETLGGEKPPGSIVLISDGRASDLAKKGELFRALAGCGVPVYAVPVSIAFSSAPNLRIATREWPSNVRPGDKFELRASFTCTDSAVRSGSARVLDADGKEVAKLPLSFSEGKAETKAQLTMPLVAVTWRLEAAAVPGEIYLDDNSVEIPLSPRHDAIRVLYMEGSPESLFHRGVQRAIPVNQFLPIAWKKAGMEVDVFAVPDQDSQALYRVSDGRKGFCPTRDEVMSYDVIICSDIKRSNFSEEQLEWVREFVGEKGGGFMMVGGDTSFGDGDWQLTIWEKLIPFTMTGVSERNDRYRPFQMQFERAAAGHPVLQFSDDETENQAALSSNVMLGGSCIVKSAKPGATVLVHHQFLNNMPVLAVQDYGRGRTMGFTSDFAGGWGHSMMTSWGPNRSSNAYYEKLWTNAVIWLAENRIKNRQATAELQASALNLDAGDAAHFTFRLLEPERSAATVGIELSDGRKVSMNKAAETVWTADVPVSDANAGNFGAIAVVRDSQGHEIARAETSIHVHGVLAELKDTRPDSEFLQSVARVSSGEVCETAAEVLQQLKGRLLIKAPQPAPYTVPLWDRSWVLLLLTGLLCSEWAWRKRST